MRALTRRWFVALGLAIALLACAAHANATDIWTAPYSGVRSLHRVGNGIDVHVLLIDLTNPDVSLIATRPEDRLITTSEFARRYEADIAINANFFDHSSCGLMVGDGETMDSYDDWCTASIAFGRDNEAAVFDSETIQHGPLPASWMADVLTGKPFLMRDGRALTNWTRPQHLYRPNPRTAVGLTGDRHTLVIVVADGRRYDALGLTGFQLVRILREFDVTDAVNFDGGGSSELVMGGAIVNHPSDHRERTVLSHLGVRIHPGARWNAAQIEALGGPPAVHEGTMGTVWLEARNLGRTTWKPERDGGGSPTLELDDGAVSYTASVRDDTPPGAVGRFEVSWLARGGGARTLRAKLRLQDGTLLGDDRIAWNIDVPRAPEVPGVVPQRAIAVAQASQLELPAGMGAVFVGAHGCAARPEHAGPGGFGAIVAAMIAALGVRRRRAV